MYSVVEAIASVAVAALLWRGGLSIVGGALTLGVLVQFTEYLAKFFAPLRELSAKYTVMQQAMAAAERVFGLLDTRQFDGAAVRDGVAMRDGVAADDDPGVRDDAGVNVGAAGASVSPAPSAPARPVARDVRLSYGSAGAARRVPGHRRAARRWPSWAPPAGASRR